MQAILEDINAMSGVLGSFVCDEDGQTMARALPAIYDDEMLAQAGRTAAQTTTGLWMAKRRPAGEIDLLFSNGRLIVKVLDSACLCILCTPRLNLPLLNMTANVAVKKLQKKISEVRARPKTLPRHERLKEIARELLGDRSRKIVDMLSAAGSDDPAALRAVCDEAVRFTGFFMSKDKAEELGRRMRAVIDQ